MAEITSNAPGIPVTVPLLPLAPLLVAVGHLTRWQILRALAAGEPLQVTEMAAAIGCSADVISKHLTVLRRAGITEIARGLQRIVPAFLVDPQNRVLDFGYLQLHLLVERPA